jgi:hypothetical protein
LWVLERAVDIDSGRRTAGVVLREHHRAALLRRRRLVVDRLHRRCLRRHLIVDVADHQRAALRDIGVAQRGLLDAVVVVKDAVRATEILDDVDATFHADLRVSARHHAVVGADRALETAAHVDGLGRRQLDRSLPALAVTK